MAAFLFALIFLFPQVSLAADYSNDSNSININYTGSEPDVLSGGSSGGGDGSGSTGGAGETGGGGGGLVQVDFGVGVLLDFAGDDE
jgi:hypothetical protein